MNDTVNDLHAAEDAIGALRHSLAVVWEFAENFPYTGLGDAPQEIRDALALGMAISDDYCRPSCELDEDDTYLCHNDCGCPGRHAPSHDQRNETS